MTGSPHGAAHDAPLTERMEVESALPPSWCVVDCGDCHGTWTVDTADFEPRLTAREVEAMLTPLLTAHDVEHGRW